MDGLSVGISMIVQYRLKDNINDVLNLYLKYGMVRINQIIK